LDPAGEERKSMFGGEVKYLKKGKVLF